MISGKAFTISLANYMSGASRDGRGDSSGDSSGARGDDTGSGWAWHSDMHCDRPPR